MAHPSATAVPTFDDQDDLPVTWAFIRESYRWRPVSSGGEQDAVCMEELADLKARASKAFNTRLPRTFIGYVGRLCAKYCSLIALSTERIFHPRWHSDTRQSLGNPS